MPVSESPSTLREQAERFPKAPGIYFFRNKKGRILYIGKAKNLRNRIFQYIRMTDGRRMVGRLLSQSKTLDFTITKDEKQALILEAKQIQEHKPKFNVQLLDGRAFLHFHLELACSPHRNRFHQYHSLEEYGIQFKTNYRSIFL